MTPATLYALIYALILHALSIVGVVLVLIFVSLSTTQVESLLVVLGLLVGGGTGAGLATMLPAAPVVPVVAPVAPAAVPVAVQAPAVLPAPQASVSAMPGPAA